MGGINEMASCQMYIGEIRAETNQMLHFHTSFWFPIFLSVALCWLLG